MHSKHKDCVTQPLLQGDNASYVPCRSPIWERSDKKGVRIVVQEIEDEWKPPRRSRKIPRRLKETERNEILDCMQGFGLDVRWHTAGYDAVSDGQILMILGGKKETGQLWKG